MASAISSVKRSSGSPLHQRSHSRLVYAGHERNRSRRDDSIIARDKRLLQ